MKIEDNKKGIAIVPGSFDPITVGHMDIVGRAAMKYGKVYLAVMINSEKKYMFSMEERVRIATAAVSNLSNVEVISSDGMLWSLAKELGAEAIVKGYRNDRDLEYERSMAEYNREHYPYAETVLLRSKDELADISSTLLREKIKKGEALDGILPDRAIEEFNKIISEHRT